MIFRLFLLSVVLLSGAFLTGCDQQRGLQEDMEETGESVGESIEETGEEIR